MLLLLCFSSKLLIVSLVCIVNTPYRIGISLVVLCPLLALILTCCCIVVARGGVQGAIERAAPTLAAAHAISRAVSIPVMAASGLSDVTAPMALAAGARGVGVGSAGVVLVPR